MSSRAGNQRLDLTGANFEGAITPILIERTDGEFDLAAVEAFIQTVQFTVRDPLRANVFFAAEHAETLQSALAERTSISDRIPSSVLIFRLAPARITIACLTRLNRPARALVTWVQERNKVRFLDEEFTDISADASLDYLFGPPP